MKNVFISIAWIFAAIGMYGGFLGLEFCWNVPFWDPGESGAAWLIIAGLVLLLLLFWFLSQAPVNRVVRIFSLLICLSLVALAIYILPAEATKPGLFARPTPSALWYRGGRAVFLALPAVFWAIGFLQARSASERSKNVAGKAGYT